MINNVVLVGRVVKELDLKYIQSGNSTSWRLKMIMLIVQAINSTKGTTNRILVAIINQLIHSIALASLLILVMMTFHSEKGDAYENRYDEAD